VTVVDRESLDIFDQVVVFTNVQIVPYGSDTLRLYFFHVWLARAREGNSACSCTSQVFFFPDFDSVMLT
jgi:hypothetical protein